MGEEFDAELRDARYTQFPNGKKGLFGEIFNDSKGRFKDGEKMYTSFVVNEMLGNDLIATVNTIYKVTFKEGGRKWPLHSMENL